ncbi:MAG TPA: hypothetical protein VKZ85_12345 [Woeseiaceae bacterium]|nr:hypothetical protein [Woeseiaceae bacterium]
MHLSRLVLAIPLSFLAGAPALSAAPEADPGAIDAALANPDRPAEDREQDGWRKADEVLEFLGLHPGMHVIDYFAADGYYSELMSYVVGPEGRVVAYNNAPYLGFSGDTPAQRYANERLPNVVQVTTAPEELALEPGSLDAALFVWTYHDLYWQPKDERSQAGWPVIDPEQALAKLVPALKPGAVVVVVDHVAPAGSDPVETVDAAHRIDPAVIRRDFEAAGFVFDAESPVFRNPDDDHATPVFDDAIRYRTDQVMYRFRKK